MIDINFPLLCAQIVTFLMAVAVLWKVAWGPLCTLLTERSSKIKNDLLAVEQAKVSVAKLEEEYRLRLRSIQEKANELAEEARKAGAKEKEEIIRLASREAELLIEKTRIQLNQDKDRLIQELRSEVSGLSVAIAQKLLGECMNKELQDKLFLESVRQIESIKKH
jgi:F-type H+-transporting ATPase subunit b